MTIRSALYNVMYAAAIKASKGISRDFGEVDQLQVSRKGTANFVTNTDKRAEKILQQELAKARPTFGFLMEEAGEVKGSDPSMRWVIDPLDGTTNFIHATPYFAISIAVEKTHPNGHSEILAGLVYDPIHNEMFFAEKGAGAYLNERRLMVSRRQEMGDMLFATGALRFSDKEQARDWRLLTALTDSGAALRMMGAAALDLAYVAAGRYDGYWHFGLKRWDIAAGLLLVTEAGGMVADIQDGKVLETGDVIAAAPAVGEKMKALLRPAK